MAINHHAVSDWHEPAVYNSSRRKADASLKFLSMTCNCLHAVVTEAATTAILSNSRARHIVKLGPTLTNVIARCCHALHFGLQRFQSSAIVSHMQCDQFCTCSPGTCTAGSTVSETAEPVGRLIAPITAQEKTRLLLRQSYGMLRLPPVALQTTMLLAMHASC